MKEKKLKYGHIGRPTKEEVKSYKKRKILKILGVICIFLMIIGGIFIYKNRDEISLRSIMGNSAVDNQMKTVQNSSKYKTVTFSPDTYKDGYYYQTYANDGKTKFLTYLFNQTGHSSSRYSWSKVEIYRDGIYLKQAKSTDKNLRISKKHVGKTLALKFYIKSKATGSSYIKYLKLYVTSGNLNQNNNSNATVNSCSYNPNGKDAFLWPIGPGKNGKPQTTNISSGYNNRSLNGKSGMHYGIDISKGDNPTIIAIYDGVVTQKVNYKFNTYKSKQANYGTYVIIEHNYKGKKLYSIYAHMQYNSIPNNIYVGAKVKAGTKLGVMGNTGYSSGTHLHFEMRLNDTSASTRVKNNVNPLSYVSNKNPYPTGKWKCK